MSRDSKLTNDELDNTLRDLCYKNFTKQELGDRITALTAQLSQVSQERDKLHSALLADDEYVKYILGKTKLENCADKFIHLVNLKREALASVAKLAEKKG